MRGSREKEGGGHNQREKRGRGGMADADSIIGRAVGVGWFQLVIMVSKIAIPIWSEQQSNLDL